MNPAHLHLMLSHLPLAGVFFALIIWAMGRFGKREGFEALAGWMLIVCAAAFIGLYFSGEGAEEQVEHLSGVMHDDIEAHEEAAKPVFIGSWIMLAVGLFAWWRGKKGKQGNLNYWVPVFSLAMLILGAYTAWQGGKIRHPEVRGNQSTPAIAPHSEGSHDD